MRVELPNRFTPRAYQADYMRYFDRGGKRAMWVVHRRGGKDLTALHQTAKMAHQRRGDYWHIFPESEQGRKAIWTGFTKDGDRIMEQVFPAAIRKSPRAWAPQAETVVELKCGSVWRLLGSDKMSLVGSGPFGVVFSEYAQAKPSGWNFIRPMLAERDGWASFITTPRGHNHAWELYQRAKADPDWFCAVKTLYDTRAYDPEATIAAERASGMPEELIRQEYLCDWNAALVGSIWGPQLEVLETAGHVGGDFDHGNDGIFVSFDLGISDSTALWFWRLRRDEDAGAWGVDFVDFYESAGQPLSHYLDELEKKGYRYEKFWLPHDARARTLATGVSILDQFTAECRKGRYGSAGVAIGPELSLLDGIQAGRWLLQQPVRFHSRCEDGVEALRQYHYRYDEDKHTYSGQPEHDWSSHCFVGSTEVLTRNGACQMQMLPSVGEVMTPCGWKPYRSPRLSRKDAPLVEVAFAGGHSVRCTPEHLFLTDAGWTSAVNLRRGSKIQSVSMPSPNTSTAVSIGRGLASAILPEAAKNFIARCGKRLSDLFRMDATSIIATTTPATIASPIWSACQPANIYRKHGTHRAEPSTSLRAPGRPPVIGTSQRRDGSGTVGRPRAPGHGRNGSAKPGHAGIVARAFRLLLGRMGIRPSGVPSDARLLAIDSVTRLTEVADVWDLTVPGMECFALANGAVVHNSADAYRYTAIVVKVSEMLTRKPQPPKSEPVRVRGPTMDELWAAVRPAHEERIG